MAGPAGRRDFRLFPGDSFLNRLGFAGSASAADMSGQQGLEVGFKVAHWFVMVLALCLPVVRLARSVRRRSRRGPGLCPQCGYGLRATSDRCQECGRPVSVIAPG